MRYWSLVRQGQNSELCSGQVVKRALSPSHVSHLVLGSRARTPGGGGHPGGGENAPPVAVIATRLGWEAVTKELIRSVILDTWTERTPILLNSDELS